MRTGTAVAAGILFGLAGLAGGRALAALEEKPAAPAPAACTPVAFVNINRVFKEIPRAKKLVEDLTAEGKALTKALADREKDLRKKGEELAVKYDPGTPEYEKERRALELEMAGVQYDKRFGLEAINRKQAKGMAAVYREVCTHAELVAESKGFACVFNLDTDPVTVEDNGQVLGINELKLQLALRTALWSKPELDITTDVIAALNK